MGREWDKFLLLMWKNWKLQYRKPLQTIFEIIAPVLFTVLLVVIRSLEYPKNRDAVTFQPYCPIPFPPFCDNVTVPGPSRQYSRFTKQFRNFSTQYLNLGDSTDWNLTTVMKNYDILYSPTGNPTITTALGVFSDMFREVKGFSSAAQLQNFFETNYNSTFAGIQFDGSLANNAGIPDDLQVDIRFPGELRTSSDFLGQNNWRTSVLYPVYQMPGPREPKNNFGAVPGYYAEGFLTIQASLTYSLIISQLNLLHSMNISAGLTRGDPGFTFPIIKMQRFPHSPWIEDMLVQVLQSFAGLIIMLSFVYSCINIVRVITMEKEKQLKEAMKIMGLPNWLHWSAWFIKTFTFLLHSVVLIVILLKIRWYPGTSYSVFTYSDPLLMIIFMLLYMCATITFCFAISVFFSKANFAATVAGLLWFISYFPYLLVQQQYQTLTTMKKLLLSLFSNTAMAFGFQLMLMFESTGEGIHWYNVWKTSTPDDHLTLGLVMIMLIVDSLIYLAIALYVEAVFPGEYGVPQPWYFPFNKCIRLTAATTSPVVNPEVSRTQELFEPDPTGIEAGIRIINLRKVFGRNTAVRHLSLNIYQDQITVLLGHNGAGKTTTMSMLTGMFPPTDGTAIVNGYDVTNNMAGVRASLGICPQHNILFDDLTVREHLYFFSKLKGLRGDEVEREVHNYIELLELVPKADKRSSTLSGGMKRKLCVGMALCGNSKVVMLDEPTAGMDPSARRALWDLIQKQKANRTILLTTHFMDEADLLGDRIAILAGGKLQCCGSSFFLKKKYGAGYHLIMVKNQQCQVPNVTALLQRHIPNIEVDSNIGSELTYLLTEDQASVFEAMLRDLEDNSLVLGIRSYGISLTTLEEVFMKVGADLGQEETYNSNEFTDKSGVKNSPELGRITNAPSNNPKGTLNGYTASRDGPPQETRLKINTSHLSGFKLIRNQFLAMFMKKGLSTVRSWALHILQGMVPVILLILAVITIRLQKRGLNLPKLDLTLDSYNEPVTLVQTPDDSTGMMARFFQNTYVSLLEAENRKISFVDNINDEMINLTAKHSSVVRLHYIAGFSVEPGLSKAALDFIVKAWFNNDPYHSPAQALSLVLNAVYNVATGGKTIRFANNPLPFTPETKVRRLLRGDSLGFSLAFNISFSMSFISAFYVLFYVRERTCNSKHLQFVSGVKVWIFWITAFICDLLSFTVMALALLITLACFQEEGFQTPGRLFLVLMYFGCSMLPMMYLAAYFFEIPSTGYAVMTLFSIFTGVTAFMIVQILCSPDLELKHVGEGMHWFFLIIPHYSLATGIRDIYTTYTTSHMCNTVVELCLDQGLTMDQCLYAACHTTEVLAEYCCSPNHDYFKWESPGIGRNILYSFLVGAILFALLLIDGYEVITRLRRLTTDRFRAYRPRAVPDEDNDVADEKRRIENASEKQLKAEHTLVLKDVTKYYGNFLAVNGLCLGVKKYECFGLLGVNGAGKTTTFKMMTGDVKMTYGEAWVNGRSIRSELKHVQKMIGYCPQFDALLDDLTASESLIMFALLRGMTLHESRLIAAKLAEDFDFKRHLNKQVKKLSGGNKRKLSTAISLIGDPPVIYLDEPTTGMDPATKRYLLNTLCQVRNSGKCIVLTSHSMDECEALCTSSAIMVNGNFKCLGSTQHLKNKFAEGYTLTIKIKKDPNVPNFSIFNAANTDPVVQFVMKSFPTAILREKHQELLTFYIVDKKMSWSKMFGIIERGKKQLNIEDYSLGQSSLEQVFLTFVKSQVESHSEM